MFKRFLIGIAALAMLAAGGCYLFVTQLMEAGNARVSSLIQDFETLPDEQLVARFRPEVFESADQERILVFARAIPARLGKFQELPFLEGNLNIRTHNARTTFTYAGKAVFEKGTVDLDLVMIDDEVRRLQVLGEVGRKLMQEDMSVAPSDPGRHPEAGARFLEALLAGDREAAFQGLAPATRAEWGKQGLDQRRAQLGLGGPGGAVEYLGTFEAGREDALGFRYRVGEREVRLVYAFQGFAAGVAELRTTD